MTVGEPFSQSRWSVFYKLMQSKVSKIREMGITAFLGIFIAFIWIEYLISYLQE